MSAPALAGRPSLTIRGTPYPVLLPTVRDPRLHLAAVIVSLQVLGQAAFGFDLSIAQILVALGTSAALEVAIAFFRHRVLMWPASALLTGNGVAFVLRVPGTEHGDWWSLHGWWIFAGTAAVALLSKHVLHFRGGHVFNPSNLGLVLCFLLLGKSRAEPLDFWWGPMSPWMALAVGIIVAGGLTILSRLRLLSIALGFWLAFAAGIGVLAASGHSMTARWHVGPISGFDFWWILVSSPEILVFLFFMITDPKTAPRGRIARRAYAVGVGLLATLLIAPQTTERATKIAVLGALALVCASGPLLAFLSGTRVSRLLHAGERALSRRPALGAASALAAAAFGALVVVAGIPARPDTARAESPIGSELPEITSVAFEGVQRLGRRTAEAVGRDVVADLRDEESALRAGDRGRAAAGADAEWLATLWRQIALGQRSGVPSYAIERMQLTFRRGRGQTPPSVVARLEGTRALDDDSAAFRRTVSLRLGDGRYKIVTSRGGAPLFSGPASAARSGDLGGVRLRDVASEVGLDFRQGAFRFGVSNDTTAMMGGGLCWLDFDSDGWLDLFVVNSYAETDLLEWEAKGGLPRSALFRNVHGRFEDVSRSAGADLPLRGNGCVAADFNQDGDTDLYVTSAGYNVPTDTYDALLWNHGDGTFAEGSHAAGLTAPGWHAGATVGDVNGDGKPDLFVAGYTDPNVTTQSPAGFPTNHLAVRDLLYLNAGTDGDGHSIFREVARAAGIEAKKVGHGLGAVFTDVDRDGRLDLYVANDADPNQLYVNVPRATGLGFRLEEVAGREAVADPNAGMGIAAADFSRDGRTDLFVTNSRGQLHAAYRSRAGRAFADARPAFAAAVGTEATGWGDSWADLDLDGDLDLVLANGRIPVTDLAKDAQHVQVLANEAGRFASVGQRVGLAHVPRVNGRGLAAADFDNDGDLDVAVNSVGGRLILLRNDSPKRHWLEVRLPAFAPGAVVTLTLPDGRALVGEVHAGSSYLSSEDPRMHFGLGGTSRVRRLRVLLPDGREIIRKNVKADRIVDAGP